MKDVKSIHTKPLTVVVNRRIRSTSSVFAQRSSSCRLDQRQQSCYKDGQKLIDLAMAYFACKAYSGIDIYVYVLENNGLA